jgi:hypothetical protein
MITDAEQEPGADTTIVFRNAQPETGPNSNPKLLLYLS